MHNENNKLVLSIISFALLFPLFFQLSGHIYNSAQPIWDSGGVLATLPLPISIIACYGGIAVLLGNYRRAFLSWIFLALMLFAMLASLLFTATGMKPEPRKLILLLQFMLPAFGLALGQMVVDRDRTIANIFLYVLILIVPAQLVASWLQGSFILTHNLYLFGIYQHWQYVPHVLICAFAYSMVNLWDRHKNMFCLMLPVMFIYALTSGSFLAIFGYSLFIALFTYSKVQKPVKKIYLVTIALVVIAGIGATMQGYYAFTKGHALSVHDGSGTFIKFHIFTSGEVPQSVTERLAIFKLYINGVAENWRTLLLGHNSPLPREVMSSAHNWYLDMIYNFGLVSLLPVLCLICYTGDQIWRLKRLLPNEILWLSGIVFYMVLVDNNLKVTLRQPYPGIFSYFMWGLLLSSIFTTRKNRKSGLSKDSNSAINT